MSCLSLESATRDTQKMWRFRFESRARVFMFVSLLLSSVQLCLFTSYSTRSDRPRCVSECVCVCVIKWIFYKSLLCSISLNRHRSIRWKNVWITTACKTQHNNVTLRPWLQPILTLRSIRLFSLIITNISYGLRKGNRVKTSSDDWITKQPHKNLYVL